MIHYSELNMKTFKISKEEARLINEVLNNGMPDSQGKRNKLAKLSNRIEEWLEHLID